MSAPIVQSDENARPKAERPTAALLSKCLRFGLETALKLSALRTLLPVVDEYRVASEVVKRIYALCGALAFFNASSVPHGCHIDSMSAEVKIRTCLRLFDQVSEACSEASLRLNALKDHAPNRDTQILVFRAGLVSQLEAQRTVIELPFLEDWQDSQKDITETSQQSADAIPVAKDDEAAKLKTDGPSNSQHQFGCPTPLQRTPRQKSSTPNVSWANEYASGSGSPFAKLARDSPSYSLECLPTAASTSIGQSQKAGNETDEFVVVAPSTQGDPTPAASVVLSPEEGSSSLCPADDTASSSAPPVESAAETATERSAKKLEPEPAIPAEANETRQETASRNLSSKAEKISQAHISDKPKLLGNAGYTLKMYRLQPDVKYRPSSVELGLTVQPLPVTQECIELALSNVPKDYDVVNKLLERSMEEVRAITDTVHRNFGELLHIQQSKMEYIPTPFAYQEVVTVTFIIRVKNFVFPAAPRAASVPENPLNSFPKFGVTGTPLVGFTPACPGTDAAPYNPTETKELGGGPVIFTHISFMDRYKGWSNEELRQADYVKGKRFASGPFSQAPEFRGFSTSTLPASTGHKIDNNSGFSFGPNPAYPNPPSLSLFNRPNSTPTTSAPTSLFGLPASTTQSWGGSGTSGPADPFGSSTSKAAPQGTSEPLPSSKLAPPAAEPNGGFGIFGSAKRSDVPQMTSGPSLFGASAPTTAAPTTGTASSLFPGLAQSSDVPKPTSGPSLFGASAPTTAPTTGTTSSLFPVLAQRNVAGQATSGPPLFGSAVAAAVPGGGFGSLPFAGFGMRADAPKPPSGASPFGAPSPFGGPSPLTAPSLFGAWASTTAAPPTTVNSESRMFSTPNQVSSVSGGPSQPGVTIKPPGPVSHGASHPSSITEPPKPPTHGYNPFFDQLLHLAKPTTTSDTTSAAPVAPPANSTSTSFSGASGNTPESSRAAEAPKDVS